MYMYARICKYVRINGGYTPKSISHWRVLVNTYSPRQGRRAKQCPLATNQFMYQATELSIAQLNFLVPDQFSLFKIGALSSNLKSARQLHSDIIYVRCKVSKRFLSGNQIPAWFYSSWGNLVLVCA